MKAPYLNEDLAILYPGYHELRGHVEVDITCSNVEAEPAREGWIG